MLEGMLIIPSSDHDIYILLRVARSSKIDALRQACASYGSRFLGVSIQDIVYDQFPEAFEGVDALIHTASPLAGRQPPEKILEVCCYVLIRAKSF